MKKRIYSSIIVMILLIGCTGRNSTSYLQETPTQLHTDTPTTIINLTSTLAIYETATPVPTLPNTSAKPTDLITSTYPRAQLDSDIPSCKNNGIATDPPDGFGIDGAIAYRGQGQGGIQLVGGKPLIYSSLQVARQSEYELLGFSPDGKWFAFSKINYHNGSQVLKSLTIELMSADGERLQHPVDLVEITKRIQPWDYAARWLNFPPGWINDHLINFMIQYASNERGIFNFATLHAVFDPFEGVWQFGIIDELPDYDGQWGGPGISGDLTRVLYTTKADNNGVDWTVLWDLSNHLEISRYRWGFSQTKIARWSPNSAWVIYQDENEHRIYVIPRDGHPIREILSPKSITGEAGVQFYDYYWSPSSQYIALIGQKPSTKSGVEEQSLYIYDLIQKNYIFRCGLSINGFYGVYWSPDSHQIVLTYIYEPVFPLILIDINTGNLFKVAGNSVVGGWSNQFPLR
jgi:hypothetical protein